MAKIKIDKLVFGGQAMGRLDDGRVCFVWNALPGEEVEVEFTKNKGNFVQGIAKNILSASPERILPREDHYLSCSPWQIMSFADENKWKIMIAEETYGKIANLKIENCKLKIDTNGVEYGYRNKMEYSFAVNEPTPPNHPIRQRTDSSFGEQGEGDVCLGFHIRESRRYIPIHVCELARPEINQVALDLLAWVKENNIPIRSLKTMIVRCNAKGQVLAGLFLKDRLQFAKYPELKNNLVGLTVYYSTHKSPASVPTDVLYKVGQDYLEEDLVGANGRSPVRLQFGLFSFFQINVPIFRMALEDIKKFIAEGDNIVDYYSGVGAIGLSVGANGRSPVQLVESNPEAVEYAKINIDLNKTKAEAICAPSEKMIDLITTDKTIIFDPPRAGLDKRVVEKVLAELPKKIIYMSCDLATHARDLGLLQERYEIKFLKLYNFFPRTAHIEGLAVLELK